MRRSSRFGRKAAPADEFWPPSSPGIILTAKGAELLGGEFVLTVTEAAKVCLHRVWGCRGSHAWEVDSCRPES
jgi:hypothetical protein